MFCLPQLHAHLQKRKYEGRNMVNSLRPTMLRGIFGKDLLFSAVRSSVNTPKCLWHHAFKRSQCLSLAVLGHLQVEGHFLVSPVIISAMLCSVPFNLQRVSPGALLGVYLLPHILLLLGVVSVNGRKSRGCSSSSVCTCDDLNVLRPHRR